MALYLVYRYESGIKSPPESEQVHFPKMSHYSFVLWSQSQSPRICGFAVWCGREDLFQEHPQQHQVQHQAVSQEDPWRSGQDDVSVISPHITQARPASYLISLTRSAKQLKKVNIFEIPSELAQLRLTLDTAVSSPWACVSVICLTCLTCVPANPF